VRVGNIYQLKRGGAAKKLGRYPAEQFGTVNGRLALPVNLVQALTPFAVGLMLTWTGSYLPSLLPLFALAGGAVWSLQMQGRKPSTISDSAASAPE